ncbi:cystathionine beta-lyase [Shewanella sp. 202IG2-18]|uniref:cystathionine beta-lyase n=1 Tax=Parashewanella hymeniacidonis TaxID=2807618 RepID=UPI0019621077|nr:cystathionine beta-lyase [Parashewanella hymeniacidonis]MBM7070855.1 cystathionine beta-lyase [Parashewanella hymeniacidonis]
MTKEKHTKQTKIITSGRNKDWNKGVVNTPVYRASTVLFDTLDEMYNAVKNGSENKLAYGRRGTPTQFALQEAIAELEGGHATALYPSGAAAISCALLSFLSAGDHLLMVDSVYEPTRHFCETILKDFGVETTYYDPMIGSAIGTLIQPNTKILFLESPGSLTMEVQDVPTLCKIAHQYNILTFLDNTWASPINCRPFELGIDVSIQAATKYIVGHSDVMMGTATTTETLWPQLKARSYALGQCVSPDDAYLAHRGLRTLAVRMNQHERSASEVATWLQKRPEVDHIRHPAFESCPGHEFFKRDFSASNGLFSFVLTGVSKTQLKHFVEGMTLFKMGFSWGGYESLIIPAFNLSKIRSATPWPKNSFVVRLHIGLEDPRDLIADLEAAFSRL